MEMPTVVNVVEDASRKARYRILAYRRLTRREMLMAVGQYARSNRGRMAKKATITIFTTIQ